MEDSKMLVDFLSSLMLSANQKEDTVCWAVVTDEEIASQSISSSTITSSYVVKTTTDSLKKYSVYLMSDPSTVITGVLNQSGFSLQPGDQVLLYLIDGQLSNSYILSCVGRVENPSQPSIITVDQEISPSADYAIPQSVQNNVYSLVFQEYWNGYDPTTWVSWPSERGLPIFATAVTTVGATNITVGIWWPAGQIFDFVMNAYIINVISVATRNLGNSYEQNGYSALSSGFSQVYGSLTTLLTSTAIRALTPQPGDEILVVEQSLPSGTTIPSGWTFQSSFMVISNIKTS